MVIGILNDRAWGMIKADQPGERYIGVDFHDADYAAIARGFGCFGERVERPEEIGPALARAEASGLPAVLDVLVDPAVNLKVPDLETLDAIWLDEVLQIWGHCKSGVRSLLLACWVTNTEDLTPCDILKT